MHKRDRQLIREVNIVSDHAIQRYCESINAPVATDPKLLKFISDRLLELLYKSKQVEDAEGDRHIAISHHAKFVFCGKVLITYIVCDVKGKDKLKNSFSQRNHRKEKDIKDRKKRTKRHINYTRS